jgi:hypothetical protein
MQQPPSEPRVDEPPFQADGLHEPEEAPDPREMSDDERAASWLHAGLGLEVG